MAITIGPARITETAIREFIPDPSAVEVYCCGPGITKYDREAARERGEEPTPRFLESTLAGLTSVGVTKKTDRSRELRVIAESLVFCSRPQ